VWSLAHTSHDRNKNFGKIYYDSNCLNHVPLHLWQDWNKKSNARNSLKPNDNHELRLSSHHSAIFGFKNFKPACVCFCIFPCECKQMNRECVLDIFLIVNGMVPPDSHRPWLRDKLSDSAILGGRSPYFLRKEPGIHCQILLFWVGSAHIFACLFLLCQLTYLKSGT
jgi:hypothetical protein